MRHRNNIHAKISRDRTLQLKQKKKEYLNELIIKNEYLKNKVKSLTIQLDKIKNDKIKNDKIKIEMFIIPNLENIILDEYNNSLSEELKYLQLEELNILYEYNI